MFPTIQGAAQKRPTLPPSIEQGAYSSPDWTDVGDLPRSAAQVEQDIAARDMLDVEHERRMEAIERAAKRNDPMQKQIAAAAQDRTYEMLQPYGSSARVRATIPQGPGQPDLEYEDEAMNQPLGRPSIGEMRSIQERLAVRGPRDVRDYNLMHVRERETRAIDALRRQLDADVQAGTRSQQDADEQMQRAMRQSAFKLHALGGISMGGFFREDDDLDFGGQQQMAPAPRPSRAPQPAPEQPQQPPSMDEYDYYDR